MAPRIAIIYYSTYGHIEKLAVAQQKGIEKAGGTATIFQQVFSNTMQSMIS
jgi:NAD(P)H dehydrogenase (quinone)